MNRIDTPQSPYELSRVLAERTGGEVTSLTLGRTRSLEDGGMQRQILARIDGERKSFVATAIDGRVSIVEGRIELESNRMHEFLKRVDEARERRLEKTRAEKSTATTQQGTAGTTQALANAASAQKPPTSPGPESAPTMKPESIGKAAGIGWPTRDSSLAHSTTAARVATRRR